MSNTLAPQIINELNSGLNACLEGVKPLNIRIFNDIARGVEGNFDHAAQTISKTMDEKS